MKFGLWSIWIEGSRSCAVASISGNLEVHDHQAVAELQTDDAGVAELLDQLTREGVKLRSFAEKDPTPGRRIYAGHRRGNVI